MRENVCKSCLIIDLFTWLQEKGPTTQKKIEQSFKRQVSKGSYTDGQGAQEKILCTMCPRGNMQNQAHTCQAHGLTVTGITRNRNCGGLWDESEYLHLLHRANPFCGNLTQLLKFKKQRLGTLKKAELRLYKPHESCKWQTGSGDASVVELSASHAGDSGKAASESHCPLLGGTFQWCSWSWVSHVPLALAAAIPCHAGFEDHTLSPVLVP